MATLKMQAGHESTLRDFIKKYRNDTFQFDKLYLQQVINPAGTKMVVTADFLLSKYRNELDGEIETVTLTDEEYAKYAYNPKRFCYDVYGTTEIWDLILQLNELYSASEFSLRSLKLYAGGFFSKVSRIIDNEKPFTDINAEEVEAALRASS